MCGGDDDEAGVGVGLCGMFLTPPSSTSPSLSLIWSLACGLVDTLQHHCLTEHSVSYRAYKITSLSSLHSQLCENIGVSTLANDIQCNQSAGACLNAVV